MVYNGVGRGTVRQVESESRSVHGFDSHHVHHPSHPLSLGRC